jgi:leucyl aminopeptidase
MREADMKRVIRGLLVLSALAVLAVPPAGAQDPVIQTLIDRMSVDRMYADVDTLVAFGTRRADQPGGFQAQDWLYAQFQSLGFSPPNVYLHDFDANTDNVIAVLPGLVAPDEIYVIGAHYDSINGAGATEPAPGADDNASGTAALLEIMRVVRESGIRFEATIKFAAFSSEELGVAGSKAFLDDEMAAGRTPAAGIAMDVMGYYKAGTVRDIAFGTALDPVPGREALIAVAENAADTYQPQLPWQFGDTCT